MLKDNLRYWFKVIIPQALQDCRGAKVKSFLFALVGVVAVFLVATYKPFGLSDNEIQADMMHGVIAVSILAGVFVCWVVFIKTPKKLHSEQNEKISDLRRQVIMTKNIMTEYIYRDGNNMTSNAVLEWFERNSIDPAISRRDIEDKLTGLAKTGRIEIRAYPVGSDRLKTVAPEVFNTHTLNLVPERVYWKRKLGENGDKTIIGGRICPNGQPSISIYDAPEFVRLRIEQCLPPLTGANRKPRRDALNPVPDWSIEKAEFHVKSFLGDAYEYRQLIGMSRARSELIDAVRSGAIIAWIVSKEHGTTTVITQDNFPEAFPAGNLTYSVPVSAIDKIIDPLLKFDEKFPTVKFSERDVRDFWPVP